jgi:hypothetical protein
MQTSCQDTPFRILALIMTFCRSSRGFTLRPRRSFHGGGVALARG